SCQLCSARKRSRRFASLSPREERAGRESERGVIDKKRLLSPALSSFFVEERERRRCCALKANLLPKTTDILVCGFGRLSSRPSLTHFQSRPEKKHVNHPS